MKKPTIIVEDFNTLLSIINKEKNQYRYQRLQQNYQSNSPTNSYYKKC